MPKAQEIAGQRTSQVPGAGSAPSQESTTAVAVGFLDDLPNHFPHESSSRHARVDENKADPPTESEISSHPSDAGPHDNSSSLQPYASSEDRHSLNLNTSDDDEKILQQYNQTIRRMQQEHAELRRENLALRNELANIRDLFNNVTMQRPGSENGTSNDQVYQQNLPPAVEEVVRRHSSNIQTSLHSVLRESVTAIVGELRLLPPTTIDSEENQ
ncbi:hypothetical protein DFS34DRAFT_649009 [Phlyctochytrium arcticum]|nr:hypothetical protein DFS34DRAFT_649009 [Phlyctochytrium arcticum]